MRKASADSAPTTSTSAWALSCYDEEAEAVEKDEAVQAVPQSSVVHTFCVSTLCTHVGRGIVRTRSPRGLI